MVLIFLSVSFPGATCAKRGSHPGVLVDKVMRTFGHEADSNMSHHTLYILMFYHILHIYFTIVKALSQPVDGRDAPLVTCSFTYSQCTVQRLHFTRLQLLM